MAKLTRMLAGAALLAWCTTMSPPALAQSSASVSPGTDPIAAALADATRPQADRDKDASRQPAAVIAFIGVKPGDKVIDIWTGSGYWARLFGKIVGPNGHVWAYVPAEIAGFPNKPVDVAKAVAAEPGRGNIEAISDPLAQAPSPAYRNILDAAWIFENYHDLHNSFLHGVDVAAYNRAVFLLLKPGGVYVIGDHAAVAGTGLAHTEDLHRIDPATVRAEVEAAGFVFDGASPVLANPDDPHTSKVFDPAIKGKTDRFILRFHKPK